ncbi:hypothetical protein JAAARDRAFT_36524 [Jaapia argillacea MUCL 33604]|uniref:Uncharacterized protein n=1 Tax=Jaapia argillacea MUCL 33604 TaxID=933084 RepID=A0A067PYI8_9AGAM|nr:hypothetical protein JAAARDRAFT_36524 [Jaapia argillacea MUCL 33604]
MLRRGAQPSSNSLSPLNPPQDPSSSNQSFHIFPRSTSPGTTGITGFLSKPSKWFNRSVSASRQNSMASEPRSSTSSAMAGPGGGRKAKISHPTDPRPILPTLKSDSYVGGGSRSVLDLSLQRTTTTQDAPSFPSPSSPSSPRPSNVGGLGDLRNISRKGWSRSADDLSTFAPPSPTSPRGSRDGRDGSTASFTARVEQYRNRSASNCSGPPALHVQTSTSGSSSYHSMSPSPSNVHPHSTPNSHTGHGSVRSQHAFPSSLPTTPTSGSPPQHGSALSSSPGLSPSPVHTRSHSFTPRQPSKLAVPQPGAALSPPSPKRKGSFSVDREVDVPKEREREAKGKEREKEKEREWERERSDAIQGRGGFPLRGGRPGGIPPRESAANMLSPPTIIEPPGHEQIPEGEDIEMSSSMAMSKRSSQIVYHSGFVNRLTDFSVPSAQGSNLSLSKGWKPYKVIMKGTKLHFYKPPSDRIGAVKDLFPIELVPAIEQEVEDIPVDAPASGVTGRERGDSAPGRKRRAFWGRRTHPELVLAQDGAGIERGTLEALVHEAVFGTTFDNPSSPSTDDNHEEPVDDSSRLNRKIAWQDFASSVALCLPSLAGRGKFEVEFVRCCDYFVGGAEGSVREECRGRVEWLAEEYVRFHGAPVGDSAWENFRKETIPNFSTDAAQDAILPGVPTSSSVQGLFVPSPQPGGVSPEMNGRNEFSPNLGTFSPRPGQGDRMGSISDALHSNGDDCNPQAHEDPFTTRVSPTLPPRLSGDSGAERSKDSPPAKSFVPAAVWAVLDRDGLTRETLLHLDPNLVAKSLLLFHRNALKITTDGLLAEVYPFTEAKSEGPTPTVTPSPLFGSDEVPHWLTKLILTQLLASEGASRHAANSSSATGSRSSDDRNLQTSRTHSRSEVISAWAKIGEACRLIGDECSWRAVIAALCSRPIARLEKAWKRVDPVAWAAVESWVYPGQGGEAVDAKEPRMTPWGGDVKERIKAAFEKAKCSSESDEEWNVPPLISVKHDYELVRTSFSLCSAKPDIGESTEDVSRLVSLWEDISVGVAGGAGKLLRVDQFMSLSLAAEPRRKGLFEPYFWTRAASANGQTFNPLAPLLLVEPLPSFSLIDRSLLARSRIESGPSPVTLRDTYIFGLLRSDAPTRRRSLDPSRKPDISLGNTGKDLGGTTIPVYEGELILVIQPWNGEPSSRPTSRAPSRPPSSIIDNPLERSPARTPSIRVKPGSSQGLDRKASLARRNSLPTISQRTNPVVAEVSSDRPLRAVVKAGTLDRLVDVLSHGLPGVSVSVSDDNGEMPLREGKTRELRIDREEFAKVWWNVFRTFVTPLVFFELLLKRYFSANTKGDLGSIPNALRMIQTRSELLETIKDWFESGGGAQDILDDLQLYTGMRSFLTGNAEQTQPQTAAFEDHSVLQAWHTLDEHRKSLVSLFLSQTMRPQTRPVPAPQPSSTGVGARHFTKDAPDVDNIDAQDFVDNLDSMAAAVFNNVSEEDLFVTADLLEVQTADRLGWFLPPQFTQPADETDLQTIHSHILNCEPSDMISELTHDAFYRLLPPSIRSCVRAFTILHKWLVAKLVAPKLGLRARQARMELYLRAIEMARFQSADMCAPPVPLAERPCVRSFVEAALTSAVLSVESRLHVAAWQGVAVNRGVTCESLPLMLNTPALKTQNCKDSLTVDLGWLIERMVEVISVPDILNASNEGQTLVNFEKRRFLCGIITNTTSKATPRHCRRRRAVDRRDFERLNVVEREVNLVEFDYRGIKDEAYRESLQLNPALPPGKRTHRPFHRHVLAQQEKNKRDRYLRDRLSKEKKLEQQRNDRREDYLNKAMHPQQHRRPTAVGQKQHRTKKSVSTAFFQFMRPISSAFLSETPHTSGSKRSPAELDFTPSQKPSFVLSAADAQVTQFINIERSYTFQLDTEDGGHYLLQAHNKQEMKKWIDTIGRVSKTAAQRRLTYTGSSPLTQLSDHIHGSSPAKSRDPTAVYGVDFEFLLHRDASEGRPGPIPSYLEMLFSEIERRGLTEPGIYRVAGANTDVQYLKSAANRGEWLITSSTDIYAVCDLVKQWFRDLPRPVLPSSSYFEIIAASKLDDLPSKLARLRNVIQHLPQPNFDLLRRVAEHLDKVTDYEDQNHMTAKNLAIVISPSLLRAPDNDFLVFMGNMGHLHEFVKTLIGHLHLIFDEDQEAENDHEDDDFDEPILEEDEEEEDVETILPSANITSEPEDRITSLDSTNPFDDTQHGLS